MLCGHSAIEAGSYECSFGVFVNIESPPENKNGGCISFDSPDSFLKVKNSHFYSCQAEHLGGAIAIGSTNYFQICQTCFASNTAVCGNDFYCNSKLSPEVVSSYVKEISSLGGNARHGNMFGAIKASSLENSNSSSLSGCDRSFYIHFCNECTNIINFIISNTTATTFLCTNKVYGKLILKRIVAAFVGDNSFNLENHEAAITIDDSLFLFRGTPSHFPIGIEINIKNSKSNYEFYEFEKIEFSIDQLQRVKYCNLIQIKTTKNAHFFINNIFLNFIYS